MSAINHLHNEAMDLAYFGLLERARGNLVEAIGIFEEALEKELAAIGELEATDRVIEPTYSVLHRSASTLALDCNQWRLAEQLAAKALSKVPPPEIAEELRDLLEQVSFQRHMDLNGIELGPDEMQISLSGQAVGFGIVAGNDFLDRINDSTRLMHRIIERRSGHPFRERGRPKRIIEQNHQMFLSIPRAASFAVTLKVGRSPHQLPFPGVLDTSEVLSEFMELMHLLDSLEVSEIQNRIPDASYLRNFFGLARKIAPDGDRIKQIGFTLRGQGADNSVEVRTPRSSIPLSPYEESSGRGREPAEVRGTLLYADATYGRRRNKIRVVDEEGKSHTVEVPDGMMSDIVRPMWDLEVYVYGEYVRRGRYDIILLRDIRPVESVEGGEDTLGRDRPNGIEDRLNRLL